MTFKICFFITVALALYLAWALVHLPFFAA